MIGKRKKGFEIFSLIHLFAIVLLFMRAANAEVSSGGRIEWQFELPQVTGNPFDFTVNDVQVTLSRPSGGDVTLPAFFDGGTTWKVRHTPDSAGQFYVRSVTLNGKDVKPTTASKFDFNIAAPIDHNFVRIDPKDKMRFAFDDGSPFYPVGYDLAWQSHGEIEMPPLVDSLGRMGKAGVNWTRIWMNYWDGKNLDWPLETEIPPQIGTLLLPVAHSWDAIVDAAEKNHVHFQMVLQHHGQYSTTTDTNWALNPWSKANGGWLETPEQFFTDPRAIQLTKNKYRYIVARWGYSPSIMAFELFNEVESADGFKKTLSSVAAWHKTMAQFLREQDHYKHLITTSSVTTQESLWPAMDYYQAHAYPSDLISAIAGLDDQKLTRPYFYGEMGAASGSSLPPKETLHQILWASLMSGSAGTGEYWNWFDVEPRNLLGQFSSVQAFIKQSGLLNDRKLRVAPLETQTPTRGPLRFGPGRDWAASAATQFTVEPNGTVEHLGGMSAFLQGHGSNHAMFPFADFQVNYPSAGTFGIEVDQITAAGARLEASIDGTSVAALTLGQRAGPRSKSSDDRAGHVNATLEISVPAGSHSIRLENTGDDWLRIHQFVLTPYAPELAVLGKTSTDLAVLWVYRRSINSNKQPVVATIKIDDLTAGQYRVAWWDTEAGKIATEATAPVTAGTPLLLVTPPVDQDIACWITREN